ncbi:UNVERIFIED_CONTAM: hypothetical protein FKN15_054054 [Acipenser sinensis]
METEPKKIREGYLVKKGTVFNSWKAMWVVLFDDGIEFYKKKTDSSPKGMIPLKGGSISSLCQDFGKRMGHRRKNWKVRKCILRDDPAYMHYYDPTKGEDYALGAIHLRGSVVTAIEHVQDAKKYDIEGNLFEIITSDETHYFLQAATPTERKEWIQAIQTVAKTGK